MNYELYIVNSFVFNNEGGNKAGIVLNANTLLDDQMQKIAAIHGLSEIVFCESINEKEMLGRFFTPNSEIEFCGHATVGLYGILKELGIIVNGDYSLNTKAGIINVKVKDDNILTEQILPKYGEIIDSNEIASSLKIDSSKIIGKCQKVSTGLYDIIIQVESIDVLNSLKPDFNSIKQSSKLYDSVGYHVFAESDGEYYTRNFAPLYDIDEESATGSASGALACYMYINELLPLNKLITFRQGYSMQQPSHINVTLEGKEMIDKVLVGGKIGKYSLIRGEL